MKVIHKLTVHLDDRHLMPCVEVMQGDAYTRVLELTLLSGGEPWTVPEGASVAVAYGGAGGKGIYDTLPDGSAACTVSGNTVTAVVAPQAIAVAGDTRVTVVFTDGAGGQLATFCVTLKVERNPAVGASQPSDYINLRQWLTDELQTLLDELGGSAEAGKSAYEYAQEGGYTGTEEEFAAKLAKEYVAIDEEGNARLPLAFNICDEEGEPMVDVNCYSDGNDQLILFLEASVGGPVQLKGVAAGVEDDQAVNVKQLREAVGESAVFATVEQTDTGATVTISDKNGTTTADLVNGEDGKTPVKGVDYYTEADKAEMVELVLAALPDGSEVAY